MLQAAARGVHGMDALRAAHGMYAVHAARAALTLGWAMRAREMLEMWISPDSLQPSRPMNTPNCSTRRTVPDTRLPTCGRGGAGRGRRII